jgi:hypothetical protein
MNAITYDSKPATHAARLMHEMRAPDAFGHGIEGHHFSISRTRYLFAMLRDTRNFFFGAVLVGLVIVAVRAVESALEATFETWLPRTGPVHVLWRWCVAFLACVLFVGAYFFQGVGHERSAYPAEYAEYAEYGSPTKTNTNTHSATTTTTTDPSGVPRVVPPGTGMAHIRRGRLRTGRQVNQAPTMPTPFTEFPHGTDGAMTMGLRP